MKIDEVVRRYINTRTFKEMSEKFQIGMGDDRTDKELQDQISNLSDKVLKIWSSKPSGFLGTKIAKTQDKMVKTEMKKRGLR